MLPLFLDIETIPGQTEAAREIAKTETRPPGNIKKEESLAAWWEEHGQAAIEENWRKQALDPALGEMCAIGYALGEEAPAQSIVRSLEEPEGDFLRRALQTIERGIREMTARIDGQRGPWDAITIKPVAHNTAFDFGFLRARCWANRIRPPYWLPRALDRQGKDYEDTMTLFAGYGGRVSLSRLARCLGLPDPKAETDGGAVFDLWKAGEHDKLAAYNMADVEACRACWLVMTGHECETIAC
jgi:hypothetical protein